MRKLTLLLVVTIVITSCSEPEKSERIQWTSSSEVAKNLFEEFLINFENYNWEPKSQEALFDSITKLDPEFYSAKIFNGFKGNEERRALLRLAYNNRSKVSDLESRLIELNYEGRIKGNINRQDQILDSLILDYPKYYQLYIWSGDVKNQLDVKASEKRYEEALLVNSNSFAAYVNLAFFHFPTDDSFLMLATNERDLKKAEMLLNKAKEIFPESSRPPRFLGNIYRAQSKFDKALSSYNESLNIIEKFETGTESNQYANSLLMVGHVYTFQGQYEKARSYYDNAISISNEGWMVSINVLKSQTFLYQKNFAAAVNLLSEVQNQVSFFDLDEVQKINFTEYLEFSKFIAFGHSNQQLATQESINKMKDLRASRRKILLSTAQDEKEKQRIETNFNNSNMETDIWFNILFGNYEEASVQIGKFKSMSEVELEFNPTALNSFYKFSGYLNLMEGNPQESINDYSNLSKEDMTGDSYHSYFLALAKKAIGEEEASKLVFIELANDNFATWQNAIIKNLAKAQIKTNL